MESYKDSLSSSKPLEGLSQSVNDSQKSSHSSFDPVLDNDPIKAAERTGPRVYTLENHQGHDLRFFVFGCQGDLNVAEQKKVANLIRETILLHPELKPDFIILLGDNFYPDGVDSPLDARFNTQFYEMYGIPCFVIPGNHDFNKSKVENIKNTIRYYTWQYTTAAGIPRAMQQVAHSYLFHATDPAVLPNKVNFYRQDTLDYTLLPRWNMPWIYYSVIVGKVQLFFLDSTNLAEDYLALQENPLLNAQHNQIAFLKEEFVKCQKAGRTPILFQHHPLVTCGKRGKYGKGDARLYFKSDERWNKIAKEFGLDQYSYQYNQLLLKIFTKLGIKFAANFGAHDHCIYNYVDNDICQFIVGSGGGELQDRHLFKNHENIGFYLKELGFMSFFCNKSNPKIMSLDVFTTKNQRLTLSNSRARPITKFLDSDTAELYETVLEACGSYASNPTPVYSLTMHLRGPEFYDIDRMHEIMAYFCQPTLGNFQSVLNELSKLMSQLVLKTDDDTSLYSKINKLLKKSRFGKTVAELLDVNVKESVARLSHSY